MTKKDYAQMAEAFNEALIIEAEGKIVVPELIEVFMEIAKKDNPNFDKTRFENAYKKN